MYSVMTIGIITAAAAVHTFGSMKVGRVAFTPALESCAMATTQPIYWREWRRGTNTFSYFLAHCTVDALLGKRKVFAHVRW